MTAEVAMKQLDIAPSSSPSSLLPRLRSLAASFDPGGFSPAQARLIYQVYRVVLPAYCAIGVISAISQLQRDPRLATLWVYQAVVTFVGSVLLLRAPARAQSTMQATFAFLVLGFLGRVGYAASFTSPADFNLQSVTAPLVAGSVVTHTLFGVAAARRFNFALATLATLVAATSVLAQPVIHPYFVLAVVRFALCAGGMALLTEFMTALQRDHARLVTEHAAMERLALSDALTGLSNRRACEALLKREMARASRHGGALSLLLVDVDNFKAVNDRFGHLVGDRVLTDVAAVFREQLRATDEAARWAGDEFLVVLPQTPGEGALVVAERLRAAVANKATLGSEPVTLSLGIATFEPAKDDLAGFVHRADDALYRAKVGGRNRVATS